MGRRTLPHEGSSWASPHSISGLMGLLTIGSCHDQRSRSGVVGKNRKPVCTSDPLGRVAWVWSPCMEINACSGRNRTREPGNRWGS